MPEPQTPQSPSSPSPDKAPLPAGVTPGTYKCPVEGMSEADRLPNTSPAAPDPSPFGALR